MITKVKTGFEKILAHAYIQEHTMREVFECLGQAQVVVTPELYDALMAEGLTIEAAHAPAPEHKPRKFVQFTKDGRYNGCLQHKYMTVVLSFWHGEKNRTEVYTSARIESLLGEKGLPNSRGAVYATLRTLEKWGYLTSMGGHDGIGDPKQYALAQNVHQATLLEPPHDLHAG